ncbi:serine/threonine protein kinase [Sedimentisphaera salicampi]|uniref:non-specific serine/threonine protein kinase n=1 Tax=Sedimentisphaera salicampi TaxID=1941349 RepID=A0A1W6LQ66_9BACT|nr:serine/threonine-protein kinase [Sedimentisphaera salicampi]ARN57891.1 Serine/threonine-protein kinase PknB [Sedimentisphaera salicampi]OXU14059.1 Serine/threonine-protein kinase PknB [Sedimentisphaera salicampi]
MENENKAKPENAAGQIPGYKILGKLGSGAMAVVYKAKQVSLDRTVAIKVLPNKFVGKSNYVERFYKEGRLAGRLNHNNIVQAYDVGEAKGLYYFVMEYVEGKSIYDDLSKGKIFEEKEALEIMIQLAKALEHAHAQGLIHRDIKPKNIMITKEGVVKLADLGLARTTDDSETASAEKGKAFGTPFYIAPEQIKGEVDIDGRADIYGLGATLYHMVTGSVPFKAQKPAEVMRKHLNEPLTPPDHINTKLSSGFCEIIETMLAKKRSERYANPSDLLKDLESVNKGMPPVFARQTIDVSDLEELEEGEAVERDESSQYSYAVIVKYRIIVAVLSAACLLLLILLIFTASG